MKKLFSSRLFALVIVCFLTFLFFIPKLLVGKVPIPADDLLGLYHPWRDQSYEGYSPGKFPVKNPLITDPVLQTYSWRNLVVENIKKLKLPLWNPYSFSGQPLLANIQSSPLALSNFLFLILPFKIAWSLQIILPPLLTALFMFLFLRSLQLSTIASMFAAVVLPFTGFFMVWMTWGTVITTAMWLPLILLAVNKLFTKQSPLWFIVLVIAASQTVLSGHWQTAFYVFVATSLYLIFQFFQSKKIKALVVIICALVLGVLISAIGFLPALEFVKLSAREIDQGYFPGRTDWFLPIQNLAQIIAPDFFGNPTTYNYWGIWNYAEFVAFIGIVPLTFSIFAFLSKEKNAIFFLFLAIFSLGLAISNPISKIPYVFNFPLISSMQPSRIIYLFVFALTVCAAFGIDSFLKKWQKGKVLLSILLILVPLILLFSFSLLFKDSFPKVANLQASRIALRNLIFPLMTLGALMFVILLYRLRLPKVVLVIFIFALTLTELFRFGYKFTPFSKLSWIFPQTQITKYLSSQQKPFRIMTTDRRIFNGNTPSAYQIEAVHGYDPLYLKDYAKLVTAWQSSSVAEAGSFNRIVTPEKYDSKITDFINVRYIITFDEISRTGLEKVFQEGETKIFKNDNVLPRAFFVKEVIKVENQNQELSKLISPDFDLKTSAVSTDFEFPKQQINADATFIDYSDQSFKLKTSSNNQAPLVLSNVFYPGWQAFIDGQKTEVKKVNFMFQSILVPKGQHQVEFKFQPQSFYNGLYISVAATIATILFSIFLWKRKYQ